MLERLLRLAGRLLPESLVELTAKRMVQGKIAVLDPANALRLLYRLIATLENHAGLQALAYGQGIHPKHRHTRYHDFFIKRLKPNEHVLDIGCGNGSLSQDMAERAGAVVTGLDIEPANIISAKKRFAHPNVDYRLEDARQARLDLSPDVIVLSNVLEHLSNRAEFLKDLSTRLAPSRFLIRVPLFERDWSVPLRQELGLDWRCDPTHETEYTQESFEREMQEAGLEIRYKEVRWGEIWAEAVPSGLSQHGQVC
jgi:2-polyprenyl-3-methyl-5-hydroxy-6-metoxy-1,4-benzoquinol methylase